MIVTRTESLTKTKYKVDLDGQFAFVLYKGELSRYGVKEGAELTEETVDEIYNTVLLKRAKKRAMHLLEDMDRTESGLREKLRQGLYPAEIIEKAIDYVRSFGYLNDARYAENFILSRRNSKSRKEIHALLLGKGISDEEISIAFENCYGNQEEQEAVRRILEKKRVDPKTADDREMQKIYGYLARKGFRYETIRQVTQNYNENA
nr:regulatory protein RecX [uncultured Mediterraneibacter sp.]